MTDPTVPIAVKAAATAVAAPFFILGIPQGMLVSALLGALLSFYYNVTEPPTKIPKLIFGVIAIAFAAAWGALALPHFTPTANLTASIPPEALAGLLALTMQFIVRVLPDLARKVLTKKAEEV